jgi:hypothetical protein
MDAAPADDVDDRVRHGQDQPTFPHSITDRSIGLELPV